MFHGRANRITELAEPVNRWAQVEALECGPGGIAYLGHTDPDLLRDVAVWRAAQGTNQPGQRHRRGGRGTRLDSSATLQRFRT
jgi:hypothetical protein